MNHLKSLVSQFKDELSNIKNGYGCNEDGKYHIWYKKGIESSFINMGELNIEDIKNIKTTCITHIQYISGDGVWDSEGRDLENYFEKLEDWDKYYKLIDRKYIH